MEFESKQQKNITEMGPGLYSPFLFDVFMETLVLPLIDLDKSPKNDLHLQGWEFLCFLVVTVWLSFFKQEV
ncbi:MAG: hypothetical protein C7M88_01195 [Candidatus Arcticimaribacter sp.]|nr:MAG: hypothetical protein C7M88_01195 [Candidatus Arcticimaribacter sp.]PTL99356.1 MAG: hypothetical protein DA394_06850 [Candidatus Arcticimaribacter sp.]